MMGHVINGSCAVRHVQKRPPISGEDGLYDMEPVLVSGTFHKLTSSKQLDQEDDRLTTSIDVGRDPVDSSAKTQCYGEYGELSRTPN